jgi:DNA-binding NarL/FixJ family response regulator
LARALGTQGAAAYALPLLEDALPLCRKLSQDSVTALAIEVTAYVLSESADPHSCAELLGAGGALRERGFTRTAIETQLYEDAAAALSARLGREAFAGAQEAGRRVSSEQSIDRGLALVRQATPSTAKGPSVSSDGKAVHLSEREQEVLRLLATGSSNKEIARTLIISENTAKFHVTSILGKLKVSNRAEAVTVAVRQRLFE